jgi:hypothetical protein
LIHLEGLGRVDLTGALVLQRVLQDAGEAGLDAKVVDVPPQARKIICRVLGERLVDAVEGTNPDSNCTGVNRTVDQQDR